MALIKTIVKIKGSTLTPREAHEVSDTLMARSENQSYDFLNWSSDAESNVPAPLKNGNDGVVMDEDKEFFPVLRVKPIVNFVTDVSDRYGLNVGNASEATQEGDGFRIPLPSGGMVVQVAFYGGSGSDGRLCADFGLLPLYELPSGDVTIFASDQFVMEDDPNQTVKRSMHYVRATGDTMQNHAAHLELYDSEDALIKNTSVKLYYRLVQKELA